METKFGASDAYTVGIEEEFQLLDPETGELAAGIEAVLAAGEGAGLPEGSITSELSASCVETRSPVYGTVAELAAGLPAVRRGMRELVEGCGLRLAAAGTHPFSEAMAQPITNRDRYRRVEKEMGWTARMQTIYGLHVHVAVPDRQHAIRALGALSRHVPLFIALSANSPFWGGADTRLASARAKIFGLVPRSGLPPAFRSWEEFETHVDTLVSSGSIPDYSFCWWEARPHPGLGTVELRALDSQTDAAHTISLAALAQCLVATADERPPENPLLTEENKWRAIRHGLGARLHDFANGRSVEARRVARDLVRSLRPVSQHLGCENELEGVLEIVEGGNGAEKQRAVFRRRRSLGDVVEYLLTHTA